MSLEAVAAAYYGQQRTLARRTAEQIVLLWRSVRPEDLDGSWREIAVQLNRILAAGQLVAASEADRYTNRALEEQDAEPDAEGRVRPEAFTGRTADGRPNLRLLLLPVITAKLQIGQGREPLASVQVAGRSIGRLVATEIADTGRSASAVAITARPQARGYVRRVRGSGCDRCQALAARMHSWSDTFDRHPNCDCVPVIAASRAADRLTTDAPSVPLDGMTSVADISRRSGGAPAADQLITEADDRAGAIATLQRAGYLT